MEFAAADLTCEMGDSERLKEHVRDCIQMGLTVLPPCVNEGAGHFTVCGEKAIRFGMIGVKSVGERTVEAILRAREAGGRFTSLQNFCDRVDSAAINRQAAESLIKAGAFDSLPGNRAQKIAALEDALRSGARAQLDLRRGQKSLFGGDTGARAVEAPLPQIPEWPPLEMGRHEKEALGLRLSFNPLDRYEALLSQLATATAATLRSLNDGAPVIVGGEIISIRPTITKGGHAMAHIEMEDLTGTIRGVVFPDCFEKHGGLLKEDAILFAVGTVDRSTRPARNQGAGTDPGRRGAGAADERGQAQPAAHRAEQPGRGRHQGALPAASRRLRGARRGRRARSEARARQGRTRDWPCGRPRRSSRRWAAWSAKATSS